MKSYGSTLIQAESHDRGQALCLNCLHKRT